MKENVLIIASPWLGGSGSVGFRIGQELSNKGYNAHFLSYELPFKVKSEQEDLSFHKVEPYTYPLFPFPIYELALAENIVDTVLRENIDVVHAHYSILFGHATMLAKSILERYHKVPNFIVTFHGSDALGFDLENPGKIVPKHLNRWVIESADHLTAASMSLANQINEIYGTNREIKVIPNFVDTDKFGYEDKILDRPVITHVSNFRRVKRPSLVLKAFTRIVQEIPEASMLFVGDGPELPKLKELVDEYRVPNVEFLGVLNDECDVARIYQRSHLLLMPSLYENFPLAALEAQSCGVPVVASKVGGVPETIKDGISGLLVDLNDIEGFSRAAITLLSNGNLWKQFSIQSRINAEQFISSKIVDKYIELFN